MQIQGQFGGHGATVQDALLSLLAEAQGCLTSNPGGAERCIESAVVMIRCHDANPFTSGVPHSVPGGLATWQLRRIQALVESRLETRVDVAQLAAAVRLSPSHFTRAFKRSVGSSPHAYILERRVARAKELMVTTSDPLSDIALASGMADQAHFCRVFRRFVGESPSVWRRRSDVANRYSCPSIANAA
jgi:AraC family transcriptional regulator